MGILALTIVATPAFAAYSFPPYTGPYESHTLTSADHATFVQQTGKMEIISQPVNGLNGQSYVYMSSSTHPCYTTSQTMTISGISANVNGFLWTSGSGGSQAHVHLEAYVGKAAFIKNAMPGSQAVILDKTITSGSISYNSLKTATSKTFTVPAGSYRVVVYGYVQTAGPNSSTAHFSNFDGTGHGISNIKVTWTAPQSQC